MAGLVAEGLNNAQVAARMYISTHTVAHHLRQAFRKLSIASRVELTRIVIEHAADGPLGLEDGWLYALGDINRHALLTHQGKYQARIATAAIAARAAGQPDTHPRRRRRPRPGVPGAGLHADGYTGRARMVVDEDHGYLLGVTFVGPGVEELIHSATVAVAGQVPVSRLWHAVPCFPSISEVWLRLLKGYQRVVTDDRPDDVRRSRGAEAGS